MKATTNRVLIKHSPTIRLPDNELKVINIGVEIFYDSLKKQEVKVIHVDWHPPAGGDVRLIKLLDKLS